MALKSKFSGRVEPVNEANNNHGNIGKTCKSLCKCNLGRKYTNLFREWPISETIMCIIVMSFGGQLNGQKNTGEFLLFKEVEDTAEALSR